jgi:hypothetical protein
MSSADEVVFLCTMDSGGSAKAWRVVVKDAGQVWAPKSCCRLVPLSMPRAGWTHQLHVPRALATKDEKLSVALASRNSGGKTSAARHPYETRPREPTGFGSGPTAEQLYVERKVARLREGEAARLLGLAESTYREIELGQRDFVHGDALPRAIRLMRIAGQVRQRHPSG